jgi:hypothetical protein
VEAIHMDGGLAGIHCCGSTEWSICVDAGADMINFDAHGYGETLALYPDAVNQHLERGGTLAFGIVPSSPVIMNTDADALSSVYDNLLDGLQKSGVDRDKVIESTVVTSSCGTGSLAVEECEQVFQRIREIGDKLTERYGA